MIENKEPPSNKEPDSSTANKSGVKRGSSWHRIRWNQIKWPDDPVVLEARRALQAAKLGAKSGE